MDVVGRPIILQKVGPGPTVLSPRRTTAAGLLYREREGLGYTLASKLAIQLLCRHRAWKLTSKHKIRLTIMKLSRISIEISSDEVCMCERFVKDPSVVDKAKYIRATPVKLVNFIFQESEVAKL